MSSFSILTINPLCQTLSNAFERSKIADLTSSLSLKDFKSGTLSFRSSAVHVPLSSMICKHAIPHHLYADDSQLYVSFASGDSAAALNGLQSCLASVQSWMSTNKLKLNKDKTEFLLIENERHRSTYLYISH